jgi:hypothetical protein
MKTIGDPATIGEMASVEFQGLKNSFTMRQDERLRNIDALIDDLRPMAILAVELLAFDKEELIDKVSGDYDRWGSFLIALAEASDTLKALQDIVSTAEARMSIALANVENNPGPDTGRDETEAAVQLR